MATLRERERGGKPRQRKRGGERERGSERKRAAIESDDDCNENDGNIDESNDASHDEIRGRGLPAAAEAARPSRHPIRSVSVCRGACARASPRACWRGGPTVSPVEFDAQLNKTRRACACSPRHLGDIISRSR